MPVSRPVSRRLRRVVAVTATATLATVATALPAGAASDSQIAKAGTVVQTDVGRDWTGAPQDESGNKLARKAAADYPQCKDYLLLDKSNQAQPKAASKDWTLDDQSISNKVFVYKSIPAASKAMTLAKGSTMGDCLTSTFQSVLGQQLKTSPQSANVTSFNAVIKAVADLPSMGDDVVGYSGGVQVNYKDGSVVQLLTGTAIVRVGRVLLAYTFSAPPTATDFATALDTSLANTVARTAKAQK